MPSSADYLQILHLLQSKVSKKDPVYNKNLAIVTIPNDSHHELHALKWPWPSMVTIYSNLCTYHYSFQISKEEVPVILVGGGCILVNENKTLKGASRVFKPTHFQVRDQQQQWYENMYIRHANLSSTFRCDMVLCSCAWGNMSARSMDRGLLRSNSTISLIIMDIQSSDWYGQWQEQW